MDVMRRALLYDTEDSHSHSTSLQPSWLELPGLCARIVGRDPQDAAGVAAAWGLIYLAAHIMDSIEDGDPIISCLADCASSEAINLATGLYATSGLIFSDMLRDGIQNSVVNDIRDHFHRTILEMCSAQHLELTSEELNLEQYWQVAEAKSGAFFALACRSGARLGTEDPTILSAFHNFGFHLGILIQITDDAKDIFGGEEWENTTSKKGLCNLPILFTLSVCSSEENFQIRKLLEASDKNQGSLQEIRDLLQASGAALYLATKAEQHRLHSLRALESTGFDLPTENKLINILKQI